MEQMGQGSNASCWLLREPWSAALRELEPSEPGIFLALPCLGFVTLDKSLGFSKSQP